MKNLLPITWAVVWVSVFISCRSKTAVSQILSTPNTRVQIMDNIANNRAMSVEMMETMLDNHTSMMIMHGNEKMALMMTEQHNTMMKMMQQMMNDMMTTAATDTTMKSGMCTSIMGNHQMMEMMQKNMNNKGNAGMKGGMNKP